MTTARRRLSWAVGTLMLLLGATAARAAGAAAKTLARFHDPVIVQMGILPGLTDHRTTSYRLFRAHGGAMEPIPFQFDARDGDGNLVLLATAADDRPMPQGPRLLRLPGVSAEPRLLWSRSRCNAPRAHRI